MRKVIQVPRKRLFGTVQLSLKGVIEFADLDYTRIVGCPVDDLIGRSVLDFVEDKHRDAARARLRKLVQDGAPVFATKQYRVPGQPDATPVRTNACLLRDPDGEPVGIVGIEQQTMFRRV